MLKQLAVLLLVLGASPAFAQSGAGGVVDFWVSMAATGISCDPTRDTESNKEDCRREGRFKRAVASLAQRRNQCSAGDAITCAELQKWDAAILDSVHCNNHQSSDCNKLDARAAARVLSGLGLSGEEVVETLEGPGRMAAIMLKDILRKMRSVCKSDESGKCKDIHIFARVMGGLRKVQEQCLLANDDEACASLERWNEQAKNDLSKCDSVHDDKQKVGCLASSSLLDELDKLSANFAVEKKAPLPGGKTGQSPASCTAAQLQQLQAAGLSQKQIELACPGAPPFRCSAAQVQAMGTAGLTEAQVQAACTADLPAAPSP